MFNKHHCFKTAFSCFILKSQHNKLLKGKSYWELPMGNEGQSTGLFVGGLSNSKEHQRVPHRQPPIGQSLWPVLSQKTLAYHRTKCSCCDMLQSHCAFTGRQPGRAGIRKGNWIKLWFQSKSKDREENILGYVVFVLYIFLLLNHCSTVIQAVWDKDKQTNVKPSFWNECRKATQWKIEFTV